MSNINTPYDNAFHTLQNDCPELIIPLVNELFGEDYTGSESIEFLQNELFFQETDNNTAKRITDSSFCITRNIEGILRKKRYHLECQTNPDGSMIVRMFEYDALIALKNGERTEEGLIVRFPQSAILYLRHTKNTPDSLTIRIETPGGHLSYPVPILKVKTYTIQEIFEKHLLFLIPFYIFCYEAELKEISLNTKRLETLKSEYGMIRERLDALVSTNKLSEYARNTILSATKNVINSLTANFAVISKGVNASMFGVYELVDTPERRLLQAGRERGKIEGKYESLVQNIDNLMKNLSISLEEACRILEVSPEDYKNVKYIK